MPVNYQEIRQQIIQRGREAPQQQAQIRQQVDQARQLLHDHDRQMETLRQLVAEVQRENDALRCAVPLAENLTQTFAPPQQPPECVLLAADGSQVTPSRHDAVEFGVINIGAIRLQPGTNQPPVEKVFSLFLCFDDLNTPEGPLTEEMVTLRRDLDERRVLADLAEEEKHSALPVIALTDGPLELYRDPKGGPAYQNALGVYQQVLRRLRELKTATAGYVDRSRSDLVVRLLELLTLTKEDLRRGVYKRKFDRLVDAHLYSSLLQPYNRSAVFAIQSPSAQRFEEDLALRFFYLNLTVPTTARAHTYLARVEIPKWVADEPFLIDSLHGALVAQCRLMGNQPYPYILHRAHEVAVIKLDEKKVISEMFLTELRNNGVDVGGMSYKQLAKDHSGNRTRCK